MWYTVTATDRSTQKQTWVQTERRDHQLASHLRDTWYFGLLRPSYHELRIFRSILVRQLDNYCPKQLLSKPALNFFDELSENACRGTKEKEKREQVSQRTFVLFIKVCTRACLVAKSCLHVMLFDKAPIYWETCLVPLRFRTFQSNLESFHDIESSYLCNVLESYTYKCLEHSHSTCI